jgi:hypothetical protein
MMVAHSPSLPPRISITFPLIPPSDSRMNRSSTNGFDSLFDIATLIQRICMDVDLILSSYAPEANTRVSRLT